MFNARTHQSVLTPRIPVDTARPRRRAGVLFGVATAVTLFAATGAQAQNCGAINTAQFGNIIGTFGSAISAGSALSSGITSANTGFLTQSTAFVSAPGNPQPGQEGGGVWVRGVGGELTLNSTSSVSGMLTTPGFPNLSGSGATTCATKFHENYAGFQVGADIAKLNIGDGWNVHIGTTAGALESTGSIVGGSPVGGLPNPATGIATPLTQVPFDTKTQSPFAGTYVVVTKGGFFADALVRYDSYDLALNSPGSALFNQKVDAHGWSVSGSIGYNYQIPNSKWFVEPSAGLVWSHTTVGALEVSSPGFGPAIQGFSGTGQINDITSDIGRVGLRVGSTVESGNLVLQPFVAASVWHDFAGTVTGTYQSCPNCIFVVPQNVPATLTGSISTTSVGTFGQYSVGVSGQVVNTGWLGFVRVDYRDGDHLQSLSGTGGIRYQFTPELIARPALPVKAPVYKAPVVEAVNWTGFYIGGFAGADFARSELGVPGFVSSDIRPSGVLAGGTLGYNYQTGRYVFGIEGDGAWTNLTGSSACGPLFTGVVPPPPPFFQTTCHNDVSSIFTLTGRAGYLWTPRTLLYLKAGAAWERETWSVTCNLGPLNGQIPVQSCTNPTTALISSISASDTRIGGLIGWGTEFALTRNWSAKAEYDWINFGTKTLVASDGTVFSTKQTVSEVKIGVNYRFDGGPVVARY
jgi:opacity protein-like surface antigen